MMEKSEVRKLVRAQKVLLRPEAVADYSRQVAERFTAQPFYQAAETIYPYLAYNQEILTDEIIRRAWADGKRVAVPKVLDAGYMEFYYIDSFDGITLGYCDIPEPAEDPARLAEDKNVLLLMPGLAFGRDHNRIGYGGGFYDRYLERREAAGAHFFKVSLAYEFQIFDSVPAQAHDRKVDAVVTASEII